MLQPYFTHLLLSKLNNLNYKQLCILSLIGQHKEYFKSFEIIEVLIKRDNWYELQILQYEIANLMASGIIRPKNDPLLIPVSERHIKNTEMSLVGEFLFNSCDLDLIEKEDLLDILKYFQ